MYFTPPYRAYIGRSKYRLGAFSICLFLAVTVITKQQETSPTYNCHFRFPTWVVIVNFQHVICSSSMFLPNRVTCLRGEIEGVTTQTPGSHNALALFEVIWHIRGIALIPRVDMR